MRTAIEYMMSKTGQPTQVYRVLENVLEKYRGILPQILLEIWQQEGFCQFQNGLYYIVNPNDWQDIVDVWMENTPYQQLGKWYALSRNAFGNLYIYNPDTGTRLTIDTILGVINGSIKAYFTERERLL